MATPAANDDPVRDLALLPVLENEEAEDPPLPLVLDDEMALLVVVASEPPESLESPESLDPPEPESPESPELPVHVDI